jgi:hypothetical protein
METDSRIEKSVRYRYEEDTVRKESKIGKGQLHVRPGPELKKANS